MSKWYVPLGYTHHNEVKSVMVDLMYSPLDTAAGQLCLAYSTSDADLPAGVYQMLHK